MKISIIMIVILIIVCFSLKGYSMTNVSKIQMTPSGFLICVKSPNIEKQLWSIDQGMTFTTNCPISNKGENWKFTRMYDISSLFVFAESENPKQLFSSADGGKTWKECTNNTPVYGIIYLGNGL